MDSVVAALGVSPGAMGVGVAVTFLAGLIHGTLGFGMGLTSVPLLALVSPLLAPSPQVVLSLPLALFMALREWRAADWAGARRLIPGGAIGAVGGSLLLRVANPRVTDALIGVAVLLAVGLMARGATVRRTTRTLVMGGIASGFMGTLSAIGGPPLALLYRDATGPTLRATLAVVFGFGVLVTVSGRAWAGVLDGGDVARAAVMSVGLFAGLLTSKRLVSRVEGAPLRAAVLVFAGVAGLMLVARAGLG